MALVQFTRTIMKYPSHRANLKILINFWLRMRSGKLKRQRKKMLITINKKA